MSKNKKNRRAEFRQSQQRGGREAGNEAGNVFHDSNSNEAERRPCPYSDEEIAHARANRREAREWMVENRQAFNAMERYVLRRAARGVVTTRAHLVALVRGHDYTGEHGRPTQVNHTHVAYIARVIVLKHPSVAPFVEFRRCALDVLMDEERRYFEDEEK